MDARDILLEVIEVDFAHHGRYFADFFIEFGEICKLVLDILNTRHDPGEFIEARIDFVELTAEVSGDRSSQTVDQAVLLFVLTINNFQGLLDFFEGCEEPCYFSFGHGILRRDVRTVRFVRHITAVLFYS